MNQCVVSDQYDTVNIHSMVMVDVEIAPSITQFAKQNFSQIPNRFSKFMQINRKFFSRKIDLPYNTERLSI